LVSMLSTITQSVKEVRELGKKFSVIEAGKNARAKNQDRIGGQWDGHMDTRGGVLGVGDLIA